MKRIAVTFLVLLLSHAVSLPVQAAQSNNLRIERIKVIPSNNPAVDDLAGFFVTISSDSPAAASYEFDCTDSGSWSAATNDNSNAVTVNDVCSWASAGVYTVRVRVSQASETDERTTMVYVGVTPPDYLDIGLRVREGGETRKVAAEDNVADSNLRVRKSSQDYAVALVPVTDIYALQSRVTIPAQGALALKDYDIIRCDADMDCADTCDDGTTLVTSRTCDVITGRCGGGTSQTCDFLCADGECTLCGNGVCDAGEDPVSCPQDCSCQSAVVTAESCGTECPAGSGTFCDATQACQTTSYNFAEPLCAATSYACVLSCEPCAQDTDCDDSLPCTQNICTVGSGSCDFSQAVDCMTSFGVCASACDPALGCPGVISPCCPSGVCDAGENCSSCSDDCACVCGDGVCTSGEDPSNCPADCGECAVNEDCDDGNPCTADACLVADGSPGMCEHPGIVCPGSGGFCEDTTCVPGAGCPDVYPILENCCGNGTCEAGEDADICPQDCL